VREETPTPKPRKGLLAFYVGMGAVLALAVASIWLIPVARLHYYAWQYRRHRHSKDLMRATARLKDRGASPEICKRLLGKPLHNCLSVQGHRVFYYPPRHYWKSILPRPDASKVGAVDPGARLEFRNGRLASVEPFTSNAIPDEVMEGINRLVEKVEEQNREKRKKDR
jgi:hypothetical protein